MGSRHRHHPGRTGNCRKKPLDQRRRRPAANDDRDVPAVPDRPDAPLVALYDRALPQVYGYLMSRCGDRTVAEDLTSETFLAVAAGRANAPLTIAWLIGVARHKLVDHWRWQARQERLLHAVEGSSTEADDPWEIELVRWRAREVLTYLAPQHRAALTLRYLDGLSVPEAATILDRTVAATEALLVRARREFRHVYEGSSDA
jgi:RNA polymerase sigma-70 factor, ECF subfamily